MRTATLVSLILLASASVTDAAEIIRCTSAGHSDVVMSLDSKRVFKRIVSCISGDFITDMTPCAPRGGFGLSASTGLASLVELVNRWQDYGDHFGGVTSYTIDDHAIVFDGGFMGSSGFELFWTFTANRLTGDGKLTVPGKPVVKYHCAKASQKF
jgi:hypothetical protein